MANLEYASLGSNSPSAGGIGWFNFGEGFQLDPGTTFTGLTGTFPDGSQVTFDISSTAITGGGRSLESVISPTWGGAAFGNVGYLNIPGEVILYNIEGISTDDTIITISNIVLQDPNGNPITNYEVIMADAESTNTGESLIFTTNAGVWDLLIQLPPISGSSQPIITGIGTNVVSDIGDNNDFVGAPVIVSYSPTQIDVEIDTSSETSRQGIAIGFAINKITIIKDITDRIDPSDQFELSISGTPSDTATTTGNINGIQLETANVFGEIGNTYVINEAMALGSASNLNDYNQIVSVVNLSSGGQVPPIAPLPDSVTLELGDIIEYTITNSPKEADISVIKTASPDPVLAGQVLTYSMVVSNAGPSDAVDVILTDTLPACLLDPEYSINGGSFFPWQIGGVNLGTMAAGGSSITVEIKGTVNSACTGIMENTATVSSSTFDPNIDNNSYTITTQVNAEADISIVKSANPDPVIAGELLTYTMIIGNSGPSDSIGVALTDTLPACLLNPEYSINGGLFSPWPIGGINLGTIVAGSVPITVQIIGTIDTAYVGTIENTATVSSLTFDPNRGNNSDTIVTQVSAEADLSVVKIANPDPVIAGEVLTYSMVVSNAGPSDAVDVILTDALPACLLNPEYSVDGGAFFPWPIGGVNLGTMMAGAIPITVQIKGIVDPSYSGSIDNTATVSSSTFDPNRGNNSDTVTTQVNAEADISVVKTANPDPVIAGELLTYTMVIGNAGPSNAVEVTLTDTLPACLLNPEYLVNGMLPWQTWPIGGISLGTIASGATPITVEIRGTIDPSCKGSVTNTSIVNSKTFDPNRGNNSDTVTTQVNAEADISVVKTSNPDPVIAGELLTYTMVIGNAGPSNAVEVTLTDTLPACLLNPEYLVNGILPWQTWPIGGISLGTIASGATPITVEIRGTVDPACTESITNTATVNSQTPDPDPSNNTSTISNIITTLADLEVIKTASPDTLGRGDLVIFSVKISNNGPSNALNVSLKDIIPPQIINPEFSVNNGLSWNPWVSPYFIGILSPVDIKTILIRGTVSNTAIGIVNNTSTISSTTLDPNMSNNSSSTEIIVYVPQVDVTKTSNVPSVKIGDIFEYTINIKNSGNINLDNVIVKDNLPPEFKVLDISVDGSSVSGNIETGINIGTIMVGKNKDVVLTIQATGVLSGIYKNVAIATGEAVVTPNTPPKEISGIGRDDIGVKVFNPELTLIKSVDKSYAVIGEEVTYTIIAKNTGDIILGNVALSQVFISDILSSSLEFIDGSVTINGLSHPTDNIVNGVDIGVLAVGATKVIKFKAKVLSDKINPIENISIASFGYQLPDLPPEIGTVNSNKIEIVPYIANIDVAKAADKDFVVLGDTINYIVTLKNTGSLDLFNVIFKDDLPDEVELIDGSFKVNGRVINSVDIRKGINIGTIKAGKESIVKYSVKVFKGNCNLKIENSAIVKFLYRLPDGRVGEGESVPTEKSTTVVNLGINNFKQFSIEEKLIIPEQKPDIEEVSEITSDIEIVKYHVIKTPISISNEGQSLTGYKLIIHGIINEVVEYTALNNKQSVHSAHYNIPFSTFIVLPEDCCNMIKDIKWKIEDIYFKQLDIRTIFTNLTVLITVSVNTCSL